MSFQRSYGCALDQAFGASPYTQAGAPNPAANPNTVSAMTQQMVARYAQSQPAPGPAPAPGPVPAPRQHRGSHRRRRRARDSSSSESSSEDTEDEAHYREIRRQERRHRKHERSSRRGGGGGGQHQQHQAPQAPPTQQYYSDDEDGGGGGVGGYMEMVGPGGGGVITAGQGMDLGGTIGRNSLRYTSGEASYAGYVPIGGTSVVASTLGPPGPYIPQNPLGVEYGNGSTMYVSGYPQNGLPQPGISPFLDGIRSDSGDIAGTYTDPYTGITYVGYTQTMPEPLVLRETPALKLGEPSRELELMTGVSSIRKPVRQEVLNDFSDVLQAAKLPDALTQLNVRFNIEQRNARELYGTNRETPSGFNDTHWDGYIGDTYVLRQAYNPQTLADNDETNTVVAEFRAMPDMQVAGMVGYDSTQWGGAMQPGVQVLAQDKAWGRARPVVDVPLDHVRLPQASDGNTGRDTAVGIASQPPVLTTMPYRLSIAPSASDADAGRDASAGDVRVTPQAPHEPMTSWMGAATDGGGRQSDAQAGVLLPSMQHMPGGGAMHGTSDSAYATDTQTSWRGAQPTVGPTPGTPLQQASDQRWSGDAATAWHASQPTLAHHPQTQHQQLQGIADPARVRDAAAAWHASQPALPQPQTQAGHQLQGVADSARVTDAATAWHASQPALPQPQTQAGHQLQGVADSARVTDAATAWHASQPVMPQPQTQAGHQLQGVADPARVTDAATSWHASQPTMPHQQQSGHSLQAAASSYAQDAQTAAWTASAPQMQSQAFMMGTSDAGRVYDAATAWHASQPQVAGQHAGFAGMVAGQDTASRRAGEQVTPQSATLTQGALPGGGVSTMGLSASSSDALSRRIEQATARVASHLGTVGTGYDSSHLGPGVSSQSARDAALHQYAPTVAAGMPQATSLAAVSTSDAGWDAALGVLRTAGVPVAGVPTADAPRPLDAQNSGNDAYVTAMQSKHYAGGDLGGAVTSLQTAWDGRGGAYDATTNALAAQVQPTDFGPSNLPVGVQDRGGALKAGGQVTPFMATDRTLYWTGQALSVDTPHTVSEMDTGRDTDTLSSMQNMMHTSKLRNAFLAAHPSSRGEAAEFRNQYLVGPKAKHVIINQETKRMLEHPGRKLQAAAFEQQAARFAYAQANPDPLMISQVTACESDYASE